MSSEAVEWPSLRLIDVCKSEPSKSLEVSLPPAQRSSVCEY